MKQTITKEVELCDRCEGNIDDTYSKIKYECPVCKRTVCSGCKYGVMEKYPDLCKDCVELPEVKVRKDAFIKDYWERYQNEEEELKKLSNDKLEIKGDGKNEL